MIQMIVVGALKESYLREGQQYFLDEISKREDVELIAFWERIRGNVSTP